MDLAWQPGTLIHDVDMMHAALMHVDMMHAKPTGNERNSRKKQPSKKGGKEGVKERKIEKEAFEIRS